MMSLITPINQTLINAFPASSRIQFDIGDDITTQGSKVDRILLVLEGAVVETRDDNDSVSHAVHFAAPGSLIGLRLSSGSSSVHQTRATALAPTTALSIERTEFLATAMRSSVLTAALMKDLAIRTQITNKLSAACHHDSTRMHVLEVLQISTSVFGVDEAGRPRVPIPVGLMERICGCPWVLIRMALNDLQRQGVISISPAGVQLQIPN